MLIKKYNELIYEFDRQGSTVYLPGWYREDVGEYSKNALIITHTLQRGGAPLALLNILDEVMKRKYNFYILSMEDGDLREEFLDKGIAVIVEERSALDLSFVHYLRKNIQFAFINTLLGLYYACLFDNSNIPVLWWNHEVKQIFSAIHNNLSSIPLKGQNIKVLGVSDDVKGNLWDFFGIHSDILRVGIEDSAKELNYSSRNGKIRFFMPGTYEPRKGHDLLLSALLSLSTDYLDRIEITFAGTIQEENMEYFHLVKKLSDQYTNIHVLGPLTKDMIYEQYEKSECVIVASRSESLSIVVIEALMHGVLCLCSKECGITKEMADGNEVLLYHAENIEELRNKLIFVIDNFNNCGDIRTRGRRFYETNYTNNMVNNRLNSYLDEMFV